MKLYGIKVDGFMIVRANSAEEAIDVAQDNEKQLEWRNINVIHYKRIQDVPENWHTAIPFSDGDEDETCLEYFEADKESND